MICRINRKYIFKDLAQKTYGFEVQSGDNSTSKEEMQASMKENLLKVNVYFKTMDSRKITESATYDLNSMLYAIGGAISLFLGISLSMIFEVIELVINLALNLTCNYSPPKRKKSKNARKK